MEYARVWSGVAVPQHLAAALFSFADGYFYHEMRPVFPEATGGTSQHIIHHQMDDTLIFNDHPIHRRRGPAPGIRAHAFGDIRANDSRILDVIELPTARCVPRDRLTVEERISKFLETRTSTTMIEEEICAVCHDDLRDGHTTLDCGHKFHRECIKTWLLRQNSCPMCRALALPILNNTS